MENQENGVITNNAENQSTQAPATLQEKKPNVVIRAGRAIWSGYQKFKRTKGGRIVTTLVKGGALLYAGYEINEAKHRREANNVVVVTSGEVETPAEEPEIPEEETSQPEETGNEEVEEA